MYTHVYVYNMCVYIYVYNYVTGSDYNGPHLRRLKGDFRPVPENSDELQEGLFGIAR